MAEKCWMRFFVIVFFVVLYILNFSNGQCNHDYRILPNKRPLLLFKIDNYKKIKKGLKFLKEINAK